VSDTLNPAARGEPPAAETRTFIGAWIVTFARWWALLAGVVTLGLALMTAGSALSNIFLGRPLPADYELVKHIVAVVIFMFLPYCQITGSNISVDIFTESLTARRKAFLDVLSSVFALGFAILMLMQMSGGMQSYLKYREVTPVLKLPLWTAFPPILFSLVLLGLAACVTLVAQIRAYRALSTKRGS
jgi:TRAP-type C4-dicarboxylate transport system permease small subunit